MNDHKQNKSILLQKQHSDSRNIQTWRSRSRLRDNLILNNSKMIYQMCNKQSSPYQNNHNELNHKNNNNVFSHSRTFTMTDEQHRIKRNYSPLYQRSTQQSSLFQKGLKKPSHNINLQSKIDLTFKSKQHHSAFTHKSKSPLNKNHKNGLNQDVSLEKSGIKRRDPNKQQQNLLQLGSKPLLTSRSVQMKKNPNIESYKLEEQIQIKQQMRMKQKKDPNIESIDTADYVVKALSTHSANKVKQVHLKFYKKENILSKENINENQHNNTNNGQQIIKQHKRHFSQANMKANRSNIEVKQNGICFKQDHDYNSNKEIQQHSSEIKNINNINNSKDNSIKQCRQERYNNKKSNLANILFSHDFYKKASRIPHNNICNKQNTNSNNYNKKGNNNLEEIKTARRNQLGHQTSNNFIRQTNVLGSNSTFNNTRIAQLRKKFL